MKDSGLLLMFLLLVIGTAAFGYSTSTKGSSTSTSSNPGVGWVSYENAVASPLEDRKLEYKSISAGTIYMVAAAYVRLLDPWPNLITENQMDPWVSKIEINLEDYRPIDPVPSSKASIRPGPVQHGTPLMPYIPNPGPSPPPSQLKHGGHP